MADILCILFLLITSTIGGTYILCRFFQYIESDGEENDEV